MPALATGALALSLVAVGGYLATSNPDSEPNTETPKYNVAALDDTSTPQDELEAELEIQPAAAPTRREQPSELASATPITMEV